MMDWEMLGMVGTSDAPKLGTSCQPVSSIYNWSTGYNMLQYFISSIYMCSIFSWYNMWIIFLWYYIHILYISIGTISIYYIYISIGTISIYYISIYICEYFWDCQPLNSGHPEAQFVRCPSLFSFLRWRNSLNPRVKRLTSCKHTNKLWKITIFNGKTMENHHF